MWLETSRRGKLDGDAGNAGRRKSRRPDKQLDQRFDVRVPDNAAATRPYFTRPNDEQPYYDILDERYVTLPLAPYPLTAWVEFSYDGAAVRAGQSVQTVRQRTDSA